MSGKGDIQRPTQVDAKTFSDNWERTFKKQVDEAYRAAKDVLLWGVGAYTVTEDGIKHVPHSELKNSTLPDKQDYYASIREKNYEDSLWIEDITGARLGANADSKPAYVGPIPTAPATSGVIHGNASEPSHEPVAQAAASTSTDREDGEG